MTLNLGILLALACAVATQLGFLYKHKGANAAPRVCMRHPLRTVRELFSSKWFAIGMAVATGAWFFHVAALAFAPLSVVQAVLSTGVVILAVLAERLFGFQVGARQWLGVGMTALGLLLLVITLPASTGAHSAYSLAGMVSFEAGDGRDRRAADLRPAPRRPGPPPRRHARRRGGRAVRRLRHRHQGPHRRARPRSACRRRRGWPSRSLASIAAFYASARGLQDGEAVPVIAATSTAANVSCILGGIAVFGDPMPSDTLGMAVQAFAFILVVVAALVTPPPVRAAHANAHG